MNAAHLALTIALRNLARARALGDAVSIAQATRRAAQARAIAVVRAPAGARPLDVSEHPTFPPVFDRELRDGVIWSERLFAQVRTCAGDGARFMAGCV